MRNVEAGIIAYLEDCGFAAFADVPQKHPYPFVTVERTGGYLDNVVRDNPSITVQCWADTRAEAANLAYDVRDVMCKIPYSAGFYKCTVNSGPYNFPAEPHEPRYQIVFDLVVRTDC